jgi:RNA polymerase sigma-70 factor (ECF subfamily)
MDPASAPQAPGEDELVQHLLRCARQGDEGQLGALLELYRNYLRMLATAQLDGPLRQRICPSDLVQEAMLGAYRDFPKFRGESKKELLAWLRRILINCLYHAYEVHIKARRRDVRRDVRLDDVRSEDGQSSVAQPQLIAAQAASPSTEGQRRERAQKLMEQLGTLRPDYRTVIVLRSLQGLSFDDVAERMQRKPGTVRMLWLRAINEFRKVCVAVE